MYASLSISSNKQMCKCPMWEFCICVCLERYQQKRFFESELVWLSNSDFAIDSECINKHTVWIWIEWFDMVSVRNPHTHRSTCNALNLMHNLTLAALTNVNGFVSIPNGLQRMIKSQQSVGLKNTLSKWWKITNPMLACANFIKLKCSTVLFDLWLIFSPAHTPLMWWSVNAKDPAQLAWLQRA